jgi:hypothetical protein
MAGLFYFCCMESLHYRKQSSKAVLKAFSQYRDYTLMGLIDAVANPEKDSSVWGGVHSPIDKL